MAVIFWKPEWSLPCAEVIQDVSMTDMVFFNTSTPQEWKRSLQTSHLRYWRSSDLHTVDMELDSSDMSSIESWGRYTQSFFSHTIKQLVLLNGQHHDVSPSCLMTHDTLLPVSICFHACVCWCGSLICRCRPSLENMDLKILSQPFFLSLQCV